MGSGATPFPRPILQTRGFCAVLQCCRHHQRASTQLPIMRILAFITCLGSCKHRAECDPAYSLLLGVHTMARDWEDASLPLRSTSPVLLKHSILYCLACRPSSLFPHSYLPPIPRGTPWSPYRARQRWSMLSKTKGLLEMPQTTWRRRTVIRSG